MCHAVGLTYVRVCDCVWCLLYIILCVVYGVAYILRCVVYCACRDAHSMLFPCHNLLVARYLCIIWRLVFAC